MRSRSTLSVWGDITQRNRKMKFKNINELYEQLGQCIHCFCWINSPRSKRDCIMSTGHKWFVPYEDLKDLLKSEVKSK